jgi:hypothetical protein
MSLPLKTSSHPHRSSNPERHLHGAAIIDEHGNEVPITESMIRQTLDMLADAAQTEQGNPGKS